MCVYADKICIFREKGNVFSGEKELYSLGGVFWKTELPSPDSDIDIILINLSLIQSDVIVIGGPKWNLLFKGTKRNLFLFLNPYNLIINRPGTIQYMLHLTLFITT